MKITSVIDLSQARLTELNLHQVQIKEPILVQKFTLMGLRLSKYPIS